MRKSVVVVAVLVLAAVAGATIASSAPRQCRSDVTVHGVWSDGNVGSCQLCPDGTCNLSSKVQRGNGPIMFTVTAIEDSTGYYAYDPTANHIESITVYPPGSQQANPRLHEEMTR